MRNKAKSDDETGILSLMAQTYANSILYSLVSKSKGRSLARKCGLADVVKNQLQELLTLYDVGKGQNVDQPTLI